MEIFYILRNIRNGDDIQSEDVMQLAALVLFSHSVYNFRMAPKIVGESRSGYNAVAQTFIPNTKPTNMAVNMPSNSFFGPSLPKELSLITVPKIVAVIGPIREISACSRPKT
uniref:DUF4781 domain-containing protein n=1 Tax=Glossina pallidipes TaxID=7398 RepID=A0A1A9ZHS5_GLOPL